MLEFLTIALVAASFLTGWIWAGILRKPDPKPQYRPEHRHFIVVKGGKKS